MSDQTYQTQIEKLKEQGLYGSTADPFWDREQKRHTCCGATRAYYHHKDCPLCAGRLKKEKMIKKNETPKWSNLLQNKCPSCNGDLVKTMVITGDPEVIACRCDFKISQEKYKRIVADRVSANIDDEYDDEEMQP